MPAPANLYATESELLSMLDQESLDQFTIGPAATQDNVIVWKVLDDASRVIDGYIGGRYVVPVTDAGAITILRPHALAIAKSMFLERRFAGKYDQAAQEARWNAEKFLGMVAKRSASIAGLEDRSAGDGTTTLTAGSNDPVFIDPASATGASL
jgi:phage gp36-like protein